MQCLSFKRIYNVLKQNSNHKSTKRNKAVHHKKSYLKFPFTFHHSLNWRMYKKNVVVCQADLHSSKITNFFKLILTLDSLKYSFISSSCIQIKMVLFRWRVFSQCFFFLFLLLSNIIVPHEVSVCI